jgi:hypothetical protein
LFFIKAWAAQSASPAALPPGNDLLGGGNAGDPGALCG